MFRLLNQHYAARENELRLNSDITLISATSQPVSVGCFFFFFSCVRENARDDFISSGGAEQGDAASLGGSCFPNAKLLICVHDYLTLNTPPTPAPPPWGRHASVNTHPYTHTQIHNCVENLKTQTKA